MKKITSKMWKDTIAKLEINEQAWSVVQAGKLYDTLIYGVFRWNYCLPGSKSYKIKIYRWQNSEVIKAKPILQVIDFPELTEVRYEKQEVHNTLEKFRNSLNS